MEVTPSVGYVLIWVFIRSNEAYSTLLVLVSLTPPPWNLYPTIPNLTRGGVVFIYNFGFGVMDTYTGINIYSWNIYITSILLQ